MNPNEINQPTQKLLHMISPMIIVYLIIMAMIDSLFYTKPTLSFIFFLFMLVDVILILVITRLTMVQRFLGKAMFPTIIGLLVIMPIIANFISAVNQVPFLQRNPGTGPEMETLRLIPLSFTALIMVAWMYRMRHVFLYCLMVTLTQSILVIYHSFQGMDDPLSPWLVVITIQFISFVIAGYFINHAGSPTE